MGTGLEENNIGDTVNATRLRKIGHGYVRDHQWQTTSYIHNLEKHVLYH